MDRRSGKTDKEVSIYDGIMRYLHASGSSARQSWSCYREALWVQVAQCSLSSMAFLLSELVQYTVARSASHEEVISRLMNAGFEVGRRAVEIVSNRHALLKHMFTTFVQRPEVDT